MESLRIYLGKSTISDVFGAVRLDQKNQVQSGIGETRCGLNVQTWGTEMCLILFNITDVFSFFMLRLENVTFPALWAFMKKHGANNPIRELISIWDFSQRTFFKCLSRLILGVFSEFYEELESFRQFGNPETRSRKKIRQQNNILL